MPKIPSLTSAAAAIRDASHTGENTAQRVGGFLLSLTQAVNAVLPPYVPNAAAMGCTATADGVTISVPSLSNEGTAATHNFTLPVATDTAAGVVTAAMMAQINGVAARLDAIEQLLPMPFAGTVASTAKVINQTSITPGGRILYHPTRRNFVYELGRTLSAGWNVEGLYPDWYYNDADQGGLASHDRIFMLGGLLFTWSEEDDELKCINPPS